MNCARNQLLSGSRFSFDQDSGLSRRHALHLFEHGLQRGTASDDLLEPALSDIRPTRSNTYRRGHNALRIVGKQVDQGSYISRAAVTCSSSTSSLKGFARNSTAPARRACIRMLASPCAVIKMIGILQFSEFNLACRSSPDMTGMRMSVIRHAVFLYSPDLRNSSAEANAFACKPTALKRPRNARRTD